MNRIVLVGPTYPYRGGIAHFGEGLYRALRERGYDVTLVSFKRLYPDWLFPGKTQYEPGSGDGHPVGVRLVDSINPASWWSAARYIRSLKPDLVIFAHWMPFFAPAYGTITRRLRAERIPSIALVHNALPHEKRPGDRALTSYFFKTCAGFIVLSRQVADDMNRLGVTAPVQVVPHPVYDTFQPPLPSDEARRLLGIPEDAPVLLFFGMIRRYKGLHVLLESLPGIIQRVPGLLTLVAGEFYEGEAESRDLVRRAGLSENVRFIDRYIPDEEVPVFFSAAELVVQPYISATQSGVAQLAFHYEKPLVVTDVGGLSEIVPNETAGLVVPPARPDLLADAVVRFFTEKMATRLVEGVRREKEKYSWNYFVDAVEQLVARIETPSL